ncbi:MAG: hypothetical protein KGL39_27285 [Patescibacteria group bacterium]|nr:hypothetical protein [Patescibacteria group bacterium]
MLATASSDLISQANLEIGIIVGLIAAVLIFSFWLVFGNDNNEDNDWEADHNGVIHPKFDKPWKKLK